MTTQAPPEHDAAGGRAAAREAARRDGTRRARRPLLALAVVAALAGAGVFALHRDESAPTSSHHLSTAWQLPEPATDDSLVGSWITGKVLIRASTESGVAAHRLTDGGTEWTAAPPASAARAGTRPCAMSPTLTADGLGTVAFGDDGFTCTTLAGIDTTTGTVLWTVPLTDAKHPVAVAADTFVQGRVATIVGENFLGGVDVRTGHRVWGFKPRGYYCNAYAWGATGVVLVDDYCSDHKPAFTLTAYDGATGRKLWTRDQDTHTDIAHVFAAAPLITGEHTAGEDSVRVLAADGRGRKLAVGATELLPGNGTDADHSARIVDGVLITPATTAKGTEVDAFDVATGKKLWSYPATALAAPTRSGGPVYALAGSPDSPQLVRLDPRTGKAAPVSALPRTKRPFTTGTVYVTPEGGVLRLPAQSASGPATYAR